jgi:hypothetical protein
VRHWRRADAYGFRVTELAQGRDRDALPAWCEHGPGAHEGEVAAHATAPPASRGWLLIEHPGPWGERAVETELPAPLGDLAMETDRIGIRVQLIRRPGYRETRGSVDVGAEIYAAWTSGPEPWVRGLGGHVWDPDALDLVGIAEGIAPPEAVSADPLYLVCAHARRDRCCGRFGAPLARELAARYPARVWETTHLGGHKHAANIALLPHGLYYGPVDLPAALDAIEAYEGGEVTAHRYRGRAGRDEAWQEAEFAALLAGGGRGPA